MSRDSRSSSEPALERTLSTPSLLAVNLLDMVGVGPFVTLPLIVTAMGGPQAMLGWLLGAALSLADGCIWSELGTAHPEAGGSYVYLQKLYPRRMGRALAFLYAWQLLLSAPLSIASGCIGFAQYAAYLLPFRVPAPWRFSVGPFPVVAGVETVLAMGICLLASALLHRRLTRLEPVVRTLGAAVLGALGWLIVTGLTHFHPALAFAFPAAAFHLNGAFLRGLGAGMLISAYDYWGYYNACFLAGEVRDPRRSIPRAVLGSVCVVGTLYLLMNISVLGVVPWQRFAEPAGAGAHEVAMAAVMRAAYPGPHGVLAARGIVGLIAVAAAASVLALLLGYSRIPFAAARDRNFPAAFGRLDPETRIPVVSLRTLTGMAVVCCLFRLQDVISTLVVLRILFQFLIQGVGVLLPAHRRERLRGKGFQMPWYPLPVLVALAGFSFILLSRPKLGVELRPAGVVLSLGLVVYAVRSRRGDSASARSTDGERIPSADA